MSQILYDFQREQPFSWTSAYDELEELEKNLTGEELEEYEKWYNAALPDVQTQEGLETVLEKLRELN